MTVEEFSLDVVDFLFVVINKDGTKNLYTIREMSGDQKGKWQNEQKKRHFDMSMEMHGDKAINKATIKDYNGMEATLLSQCTYGPHLGENNAEGVFALSSEVNTLVPFAVLNAWPTRVLQQLAKKANELNGFDEESDKKKKEEAKNE